jgi:hypothetical protein
VPAKTRLTRDVGCIEMKRSDTALVATIATANLIAAFFFYRLNYRIQNALLAPLDSNPSLTVFFVRAWWWPCLISAIAILPIALPQIRKHERAIPFILAILLLFEAAILFIQLVAFAVPLSHVPTALMMQKGVGY